MGLEILARFFKTAAPVRVFHGILNDLDLRFRKAELRPTPERGDAGCERQTHELNLRASMQDSRTAVK